MATKARVPQLKFALEIKVLALIAQAYRIVAAMTANVATFASPNPALAGVTAAIVALEQAQTLALTRAAGAVTARNGKELTLRNMLKQLGGYVQSIANNTPNDAANIFALAGWTEKTIRKHVKLPLKVTQGATGTANLVATAAPNHKKAFYNWHYTLDGGKTFIAAPGTNDAKTSIAGLPTLVIVGFQYSMTIKNVTGDWSQTVTLLMK